MHDLSDLYFLASNVHFLQKVDQIDFINKLLWINTKRPYIENFGLAQLS